MRLPWQRKARPQRFRGPDLHASDLIRASRSGVERAREALPSTNPADAFLDLASHAGVDLGDLVLRAAERVNELAALAGGAGDLTQTQAGRQVRETAQRVQRQAGRQAQEVAETAQRVQRQAGRQAHEVALRLREGAGSLAAQAGAESLAATIVPRRRRSRWPLLLGLAAGIAAGGILAYLFAPRRRVPAARIEAVPAATPPAPAPTAVVPASVPAPPSLPRPPSRTAMGAIRERFNQARREGQRAREARERELWRQYRQDMEPKPRQ